MFTGSVTLSDDLYNNPARLVRCWENNESTKLCWVCTGGSLVGCCTSPIVFRVWTSYVLSYLIRSNSVSVVRENVCLSGEEKKKTIIFSVEIMELVRDRDTGKVHLLGDSWKLWYWRVDDPSGIPPVDLSVWMKNLHGLCEFDSVEKFWR